MSRRTKNPKNPKKVTKQPPKPAYADILRKANSVVTTEPIYDEPEEYDVVSERSNVTIKPDYITRRNSNHDSWERTYFKQLLDLRNIFIQGMVQNQPEMEQYLNSPHFFHRFTSFLYNNSSTKISEFIEPLSEDLENTYLEYMIKRNKI
jgi:hypothetical protein